MAYFRKPSIFAFPYSVRWVSGLNHQFAKLTYGITVPGVRIPPSPQNKRCKLLITITLTAFLFYAITQKITQFLVFAPYFGQRFWVFCEEFIQLTLLNFQMRPVLYCILSLFRIPSWIIALAIVVITKAKEFGII